MKKRRVVVNGKYLLAPMTAVHRVADELIMALDGSATNWSNQLDIEVLRPKGSARNLVVPNITVREVGRTKGIIWEQFELPLLAKGDLVLNLCNLAPVFGHSATLIHDLQVYNPLARHSLAFQAVYKTLTPLIVRGSRHLLMVSQFTRDEVCARFPIASTKSIVVPNGCDHVFRHIEQAPAGERAFDSMRPYVVALSNTKKHKNIRVLLEAFSHYEMQDIRLVLFGSADRQDFEAAGLNVPDNVDFSGRLEDDRLVSLIKNALALACPSTTEGFGLPPLEAMALGCPAIIAPCGALPEVCADAAMLAAPDNPVEWRAAIMQLLKNPELRHQIEDRGRRQAATYTWEKSGKLLAQFLLERS